MKNKITLFFLFLFSSVCDVHAQDLSKLSYAELDSLVAIFYSNGDFEGGMPYATAVMEKAKKEFGVGDTIYAQYASNLGFAYDELGLYAKAEALYLESAAINKKVLGVNHAMYAGDLNNLAFLYQVMGNYEKAEQLFLQAQTIRANTLGKEHPEFAQTLNNLAFLYEDMGTYGKAEPLYIQAKNIYIKTRGEKSAEVAMVMNNLASLYQDTRQFKKAEAHYLEAIAIWAKALGEDHPDYAKAINNLGVLYLMMGEYTKAEYFLLQTQKIRAKDLGENHPEYAQLINNLAGLYKAKGQYDKAQSLLLQSKNIYLKNFGKEHPMYAYSLNNLSSLHLIMNDLDLAMSYLLQSIDALSPEIDSSFTALETIDKFTYKSNLYMNGFIVTALQVLKAQGNSELYYQVTQAAMRFNERICNDFSNENDKLETLATNSYFVLRGIEAAIELKKKDYALDAWGFAELNKGVLLMDAAKSGNAYKFGDLPDSLAIQEQLLQKKQADLRAALLEKRPESEKDALREILVHLNQEIDVFSKKVKKKYPKYIQLKYENKIAKATDIQHLLDEKTAFLEYVIGDSVVYIFYIDKHTVQVVANPIQHSLLMNKIKKMQNALSNYNLVTKQKSLAYKEYTENAYWFYENLVAFAIPKATDEHRQINNLIIVSDGELGHLPFEAFLTKPAPQAETDYSKLHYLSNDYKISYNYSATIWKYSKESSKNKNNPEKSGQILAMASNYDFALKNKWRLPYEERLRDLLKPLPAARKEIETLAENFNGFFAFDNDASEKNFKEKAGDYAIIHLAMHGLLDAQNPILSSLAFTEDGDSLENNFLRAYEISKMKLNADLVVLSACETGYGRFEKGNGIASLAQAFAYAGAPAMIVSLWQVNDYATAEIMKNLYQNLANGMTKDEALQQAKIKYIKEAKGVLAHPAFWSPFILMGNTDAVYLKTKTVWLWWVILGGSLALLAVGFWWLRRKK